MEPAPIMQALELQKDQQARIEVEAAEEGNTFIFSPHSPAGKQAVLKCTST